MTPSSAAALACSWRAQRTRRGEASACVAPALHMNRLLGRSGPLRSTPAQTLIGILAMARPHGERVRRSPSIAHEMGGSVSEAALRQRRTADMEEVVPAGRPFAEFLVRASRQRTAQAGDRRETRMRACAQRPPVLPRLVSSATLTRLHGGSLCPRAASFFASLALCGASVAARSGGQCALLFSLDALESLAI